MQRAWIAGQAVAARGIFSLLPGVSSPCEVLLAGEGIAATIPLEIVFVGSQPLLSVPRPVVQQGVLCC